MNYEDFVCFVQTQMKERLGEAVQIQIHRILKNNSVVLDGLSISEQDSSIAPTIYLNDFYREYQQGTDLPDILTCMEHIYEKSRITQSFDTAFYTDFEKVRPNLACRLINMEKNRELLKKVPYKEFLDLALVAYYCFEDAVLGAGTILVYGSHCKSWGISEEELFICARENTLRMRPTVFSTMASVLKRHEICMPEAEEEEHPIFVLTNEQGTFGAAGIAFDHVLQKIGQTLESDFWVLPSSVHECIIIPEDGNVHKEALRETVREINRCEVEEEEYLSDEVYFYQRELHKLSM